MNLREAIGEYVVGYLQCHEVIGMEGDGVERIRRQFGEVEERLCRIVNVAETAMAYAEFNVNAGLETPMDGATYIRERGKLWDALMAARAKAASQS